jgi:hypothetical protein
MSRYRRDYADEIGVEDLPWPARLIVFAGRVMRDLLFRVVGVAIVLLVLYGYVLPKLQAVLVDNANRSAQRVGP